MAWGGAGHAGGPAWLQVTRDPVFPGQEHVFQAASDGNSARHAVQLCKGAGEDPVMTQCGLGVPAGVSWKINSCPGAAVIKLHELGPKPDVYPLSSDPSSGRLPSGLPRRTCPASPNFQRRPSWLPASPLLASGGRLLSMACGLSPAPSSQASLLSYTHSRT